jgi:protease secretion system membrane fusion protein
MLAERSGTAGVVFPQWFADHPQDARVQETIRIQNELFIARSSALNSELSALRETENALVKSMESMQAGTEQKRVQLRFSEEQLTGMREMEKAGYLPRNRLLEAERTHASLLALLSDDQTQMSRTQGQLGEVRMRMAQRRFETQKDMQGQLADAQRQLGELDNKLNAVQFDNSIAELRSPVDGYITGLQVFTEGGVITPSSKLMEVVPQHDRMEIAGQLAVHLIDKVHPGLPVTISFPALNTRKTPVLEGRVRTVSADRLTDEKSGVPFYLVKVDIPAESYARLDGQVVLPGMPADAFVKLGERSLMTYLLKPLTDRLRSSLSER